MTAHSARAYLTPLDRLSPIARRYLQHARQIPVHPHSARRRQTSLYETDTLSITPVELAIFLLLTGAIFALLCFLCYIAGRCCVSAAKRKFDERKSTPAIIPGTHYPRPQDWTCGEFCPEQMRTTVRMPPALERVGSGLNGSSKTPTYGTLEGEREHLISNHPVGKRVGYYEGMTPYTEAERQEHGDGVRESGSSGRSIVHRDDCEQSCGKRQRSVDYFVV